MLSLASIIQGVSVLPVHLYYQAGLLNDLLTKDLQKTQGIAGEANSSAFIIGLIKNGLILLFVFVIIIAIVYSALAGFKFIQSEGASDKVEEAREALKYVLMGVGAIFIGVIGVIVINSIFSDTSAGGVPAALDCFLDPKTCKGNANSK